MNTAAEPNPTRDGAAERFGREIASLHRLTDRVFVRLLLAQWVAAIACALWVSPRTWSGAESSLHTHVWAAVVLGGLLSVFPVALVHLAPDRRLTRHVTATAQMLFSALFIHLMGGRIEAHFHVFGSLALLSFYRDPWIYAPAVVVTFVDHLVRGLYWPESVFGVVTPTALRSFEHGAWVLFETGFLLWGVQQSRGHLSCLAAAQVELETERDSLERRVKARTHELAEARDYFVSVIDSLDARLAIIDREGRLVSTNKPWRDAQGMNSPFGCSPGMNYIEACRSAVGPASEAWRRLADEIDSVVQRRADHAVVEYQLDSEGGPRWNHSRVFPFLGAGGAAAVVIHADITERVQATEASIAQARHAEALAQIITESPNEVYVIKQEDLGFEVVNRGALAATGYSEEELLGMTPLELMPELDLAEFRKRIEPMASGALGVVEFQTTHRRRDGETYPVQVSLHATRFHDTPVFVAFVTDLSELRQLEGRLAQAQKLESIGQLAAGIAHEINTPMQCVASNVEFLGDCHDRLLRVIDKLLETMDSPAKPWEERREEVRELVEKTRYERVASHAPGAVRDVVEASKRVIEIVRAMKAMSHPGGRQKSPSDINRMLRDAATISRNRWKYAAELVFELDEGLPEVPVLEAELSQVFLNLIVNAADAIHEKNGEGGALGKITLRTRVEAGLLRVEVEDTGGGVPDAIRDRIFDPFFTTKDVGKGTGQGLSLSYDVVVNKHGGLLEVLSTEGVGATFVVSLPLQPAQPAEQASPADDSQALA